MTVTFCTGKLLPLQIVSSMSLDHVETRYFARYYSSRDVKFVRRDDARLTSLSQALSQRASRVVQSVPQEIIIAMYI